MERVAFRLACSMSCCSTLGSVFAIFDPVERIRVPSLRARANSRCVCRRPCGVAYQPASSALGLNFGTSVDLRSIIPPVGSIHFVSSDGAEPLPADSEDHNQVAGYDPRWRRPTRSLRFCPAPVKYIQLTYIPSERATAVAACVACALMRRTHACRVHDRVNALRPSPATPEWQGYLVTGPDPAILGA